jgi:hypothetical protein
MTANQTGTAVPEPHGISLLLAGIGRMGHGRVRLLWFSSTVQVDVADTPINRDFLVIRIE